MALLRYQYLPLLSTKIVGKRVFEINGLQGYAQKNWKMLGSGALAVSFFHLLLTVVYKSGVTNSPPPEKGKCG
jgi:hypothetical protein